ncbi:MAG: hypothetical protein WD469_05210 [Paenibacillaceae bacterium]
MTRIFTIGEALIDFIPAEKGIALKDLLCEGNGRRAGKRGLQLGGKSAFIGKLAEEAFGDFLLDTLKDQEQEISSLFIGDVGEGDSFIGAFLYQLGLQEHVLHQLTEAAVNGMLSFAMTVAAINTTRKGAIQSLPTLEENRLCVGFREWTYKHAQLRAYIHERGRRDF